MLRRFAANDLEQANRCLRDVVALSSLPAIWQGAEPLRIAESLAASLFTTISPEFVYVSVHPSSGHDPIAIAQTGYHETNPALAAKLGAATLEWTLAHDPEELMLLPNLLGEGTLRIATRPLAHQAEVGVLAAGFLAEDRPTPFEHLLLSLAATQVTSALLSSQLLRSLRDTVAERKQAEQSLARTANQLSTFVETAAIGLHRVGPDGIILWANEAELQTLGYSRDEYIGHHIAEFHADQAVIADILARLARGEKLRECEARMKCKDGSVKIVLIDSSVLWEESRFIHTQCFTRDITERKKAESFMQSEAKRLEVLVRARTAKLQEAIGELEGFSYSVAHDVRAPLRAMQGYANAVLEDEASTFSPQSKTYLERIRRASARLDQLTQEVLSYAQLSRRETKLRPVDLDKLAHEVLEQYPHLSVGGTEIRIASPLLPVLGEESLLMQAFSNLLINACKFIEPGTTPKVLVRTEAMGEKVRLWVEDNGVGIAPEHRPRIFTLFGRVYPEDIFPGTGVGLVVVKKAVQKMGGTVGFDSEPGKGSRFWVELGKP